jgi:hypothetical protein
LKGFRKSWSDTATQRVENCLTDFVATLPFLAKAIKFVNEEHERQRKQCQEEQRLREEQHRIQAEYDRKAKVADQILEFWNRSRNLQELANAMNGRIETSAIDDAEKAKLREISSWIARHAEKNDPFADFEWILEEFYDSP